VAERRTRKLFIFALLMGLVTAFLIYTELSRIREASIVEEVLVPVVVAARDLSAPVLLTAEMIAIKEIPPAGRHEAAFSKAEDVLGLWISRDFQAGEQILQPLLVAGEGRDALVYRIPPGLRAVTIPVNAVTGVAGQVRVGDRVDVLVTLDANLVEVDRTITLLQDIEILHTGSQEQGATIILAVTPQQAEEITLADEKGRIRLTLRPAADTEPVPTTGVTPDTLITPR
jgi:pilus assembly protein CpaB